MTDPSRNQQGIASTPGVATDPSRENLLRHYITVIRRRARWIVLGLVVGLVAGTVAAVTTRTVTDTTSYYKATNTLQQVGSDGSGNYSLNQAALQIQSQGLLDDVAEATGLGREQVAAQLDASIRPNVNAIDVTAIATDPGVAVRLADAGAATLRRITQEQAGNSSATQRQGLQTQIESLEGQRDDLAARLDGDPPDAATVLAQLAELEAALRDARDQLDRIPATDGGFTLSELAPATPIRINARGYAFRRARNVNARNRLGDPSSTRSDAPDFDELDLSIKPGLSKRTRIMLGGAAGLVLGLISAFGIEAWDDRVRSREDVERLTGLGVLTEIPRLTREEVREHHIAVADETGGVAAERYRAARTAIAFAWRDRDEQASAGTPVLLVTSPGPSEGKTTTVVNLAAAFADDGRRVLVIDGDFRRPAVRRYLAPVPNLVEPDEPSSTRVERVSFLAGPHDAPTPEAAVETLIRMVGKWRDAYDVVILDTPPILTTNDAVELSSVADTVLLVVRSGRTRAKATGRVGELLRQYRADTIGVVLNDCERSEMNQYYGYGYNYGYTGARSSRAKTASTTAVED